MADSNSSGVQIERVESLAIVSIKAARNDAGEVASRLQLAAPLSVNTLDVGSLWVGPNSWLLVSELRSANTIITKCGEILTDLPFNAVDQSSGLTVVRIRGSGARNLLKTGCGIDFRSMQSRAGSCFRTRFAQVATVIVVIESDEFELFVNRSVSSYLINWLEDSLSNRFQS